MTRTSKILCTITSVAALFACAAFVLLASAQQQDRGHVHSAACSHGLDQGAAPAEDHQAQAAESEAHLDHDDHGHEDSGTSAAGHDCSTHADVDSEEAGHDGHDHGAEGHTDEVTISADQLAKQGIRTARAVRARMSGALTAPALISFNQDAIAHVGTQVDGRISELKVRLGDMVATGDVLLIIDSMRLGELQGDFLQRKTAVDAAAATAGVARAAADRAERLMGEKGISQGEWERRDGERKAAVGALKAAEAALTAAENYLRLSGMTSAEIDQLARSGRIQPRCSIRAPISGVITRRDVMLGEMVGPDRDALIVIANMDTMWALADVPENRLSEVQPGAAAAITIDALNARAFTGRVTHIAAEIDPRTRTARVLIELHDSEDLKAGMFAQAMFNGAATDEPDGGVIAVPDSAVHQYEGRPSVFVALPGEPGTFSARPVTVGPASGTLVPVLAGLDEGAEVVVDGAFLIKAELAKGIMEGKTCSGH